MVGIYTLVGFQRCVIMCKMSRLYNKINVLGFIQGERHEICINYRVGAFTPPAESRGFSRG